MAHANPEFALACRAYREPPSDHQLPPPATLGQLRARMREIGRLIEIGYPVDDAERDAYHLWRRVARVDARQAAVARDLAANRYEGKGMHGGDPKGLRFSEPKRRVPADVQAGRVKVRRGTLPR